MQWLFFCTVTSEVLIDGIMDMNALQNSPTTIYIVSI